MQINSIARGYRLRDVGVRQVTVEADLPQSGRKRSDILAQCRSVLDARGAKAITRRQTVDVQPVTLAQE